MALNHIILALLDLPDERTALRMSAWALHRASNPGALTIALSKRFEAQVTEALPQMNLSLQQFRFFGQRGGLANLSLHVGDAMYFVALSGEYEFLPDWDTALLRRYGKIRVPGALMTAVIGSDNGSTAPQAYLPALSGDFSIEGVKLQKGLPIVCSPAPISTLVVHPSFMMGPCSLLAKMDLNPQTLSIAAYVAQIPVFALDQAPLCPVGAPAPAYLKRPVKDVLPGTTLARFEQLAGFLYDQKRAGLKTNLGLFGIENTYPQKMPAILPGLAKLFRRRTGDDSQMFITAFMDIPQAKRPALHYYLRFCFLHALSRLPMCVYTGGELERPLRTLCTNVRAYPDKNLLPTDYLRRGMSRKDWFNRNKLLLLSRAANMHPDLSYLAWVDMDILRHPIPGECKPDFSHLMDGRLHIATVGGVPDLSFLFLPAELIHRLSRLIEDRTQIDVELRHNLSVENLFLYLMEHHPALFALHPMPAKHLLFLTGFDPALLDQRYRMLLEKAKNETDLTKKDMKL